MSVSAARLICEGARVIVEFDVRSTQAITGETRDGTAKRVSYSTGGDQAVDGATLGQPNAISANGTLWGTWTYNVTTYQISITGIGSGVSAMVLEWPPAPGGGGVTPSGGDPTPPPPPGLSPPGPVVITPTMNVGILALVLFVLSASVYKEVNTRASKSLKSFKTKKVNASGGKGAKVMKKNRKKSFAQMW